MFRDATLLNLTAISGSLFDLQISPELERLAKADFRGQIRSIACQSARVTDITGYANTKKDSDGDITRVYDFLEGLRNQELSRRLVMFGAVWYS